MAVPLSYNLRNLLVRRVSTVAAALGVGLVVGVFILVLALANGFARAVQSTGSADNALIIRAGANSEVESTLMLEEVESLSVRPEVARDADGNPLFVGETITLVALPRKTDHALANVVMRGTDQRALRLRPNLRIVEGGRMFRPGLPELIVGRGLSERITNLGLGETVVFRQQSWRVVGIFETGGTGFESEVWGDAHLMQATFRREGVYQSVTFRMSDPSRIEDLKKAIESDPKYQASVRTEAKYYEEQADLLGGMIRILGILVTLIMAGGAVVGAMNTMYAAVGSRAREIATLRALGFGRGSVLVSFLFESLVLSVLGGVLGCLFALPIHGLATGTTNWDTFSELSFAFRITPGILAGGMVFSLVLGTLGGLFPALRAARLPITVGLRQV